MEVMNPVNFQHMQEQIKSLSKEFFSYSTSINAQDFGINKQPNGLRRIEQEDIAKISTIDKKNLRFLIVWGCGEFGQHGLDQSGDVPREMALSKFKSGNLMLPNDRVPLSTVCGSSHSLVLTGDSNVYSWGNGASGQLGNGTCKTTKKPTLIPLDLDSKIQGISCGARHSFIWTENGYCYSFGNNFNAQLGYNFSKADFKENQLEPVLVEFLPDMKVMEVACGARHSLFLLKTGHVMAVGCNQHGQIGNDTTEDVIIPAMLDDLNSITHVACGNIHSLASHENGTVYAWGYGKAFGNKTRHVISPQKSTPHHIDSSAVVSLSGGDSHSMVLYDNGVLFTWGNNYEGQLGVGKDIKYQNQPEAIPSDLLPRPVKQIACGETTSAAITGKGQLFMWGKNAGLIHYDKPSQYFQYLPHHIEMGGLVVTQISCGAWHVSAIIINSASEIKISSQIHNIDSLEVEKQPTFMGPELNLEKNGTLDGTERDSVSFTDTVGHRLNHISLNETLVNDNGDSLMDTCFITKCSSHSETINYGGNNDEVAGSGMVEDQQTKGASQKVCFDQEGDSCSVKLVPNSSSLFHSNDKTVKRTTMNETKETEIMHFVGYRNKETLNKDLNLTTRQDNEFQLGGTHCLEKLKDPFNTNAIRKFVSCDAQEKLTVGLSQNKHHPSYTSEDNTLQKDKGGDKSNSPQIDKVMTSNTVGSQNVCSKNLEFDMEDFILENLDGRKKESSQDKCKDFKKDDGVEANHLAAGEFLGKRKSEQSLPNYFEGFGKNSLKDDQFLSVNEKFEAETIENQNAIENDKEIGQWHNIKDLCEKNSTPLYVGLHKKPSLINTHTSSVMSQYSSHQICLLKHKSELNAAQNKDTNVSQVFTQQQAVPVIDLKFGSRQAERSRIKPSLTAFTGKVWKASTLFREKQRQKNLCRGTSPGSNLKFNLENMLSHRPIQTAKKTEKRTKLKEDSMQELLLTKTDKLSKNSCIHCRNRTELLPPICLCKRNGVQQGQGDTSTNVFVNRR